LWLRRYPDARAAADRYIILGPTNPEAYQLRAMVALGEGNLAEAQRFIRQAPHLMLPGLFLLIVTGALVVVGESARMRVPE